MIIIKGRFEKTSTYKGLNTYGNILLNVKGNYYTPLWSDLKMWRQLEDKLSSYKERQKFFERIISSHELLHNNTTNIVSVHKNIFEFMRDLFTLIILDFPESVILEVMKQPYTMVNYKVIKNSLQLLTGKEDMKDIIHWIVKNSKHKDYMQRVFYALSGNYKILQFSPKKPEYQYIVHTVDYNLHEIVNAMNGHPKQPICEIGFDTELFNNVVCFCIIRPGEYSVHIYNEGKWVEVLNTIKCRKLSKKALIDMINEYARIVNENVIVMYSSSEKMGLVDNGEIKIFYSTILSSINRVYYYRRVGGKNTVYCIPTKLVKFSGKWNPNDVSLHHLLLQDYIKQKVLVHAGTQMNYHKAFAPIK